MSRVCDPFSQASIHIVVDGDCIWRVPLALRRGDDTTFDPVMNDPQADAVSRTHLADCNAARACWRSDGCWGRPIHSAVPPSRRRSEPAQSADATVQQL